MYRPIAFTVDTKLFDVCKCVQERTGLFPDWIIYPDGFSGINDKAAMDELARLGVKVIPHERALGLLYAGWGDIDDALEYRPS